MSTTTTTPRPAPNVWAACNGDDMLKAEVREAYGTSKPKRIRKLHEKLGVPVPEKFRKTDKAPTTAVKAQHTRPADDKAAVKAAKLAAAQEKRNTAQRLRLESGYVDTLHTFGGHSIEILTRTFDGKQRSMPVVRTAGGKALRHDTLVHIIGVALGTATGDDNHSCEYAASLVAEAMAL